MPDKNLHRFFISIVLPSILAIALYVLSIFLVILPAFESNRMEAKKEMMSELTNTAWSLVDEYHQEALLGNLPGDSARYLAARRIEKIRYGDEYKDYFWITDEVPVMVMHPYRPDLIGQSLTEYADPGGKRLFVEAVEVVKRDGQGTIDYLWQWKDDSTRIVPKLSYVREYAPWGWVIGTGIYLEDVRLEIRAMKTRLLRVALVITVVISIILGFVIRQSLRIETRRREAEDKLRLSRQKYKTLVDASSEGTLMILQEKIIYANLKFSALSGYEPGDLQNARFDTLFGIGWEALTGSIEDPNKTHSRESTLICQDGARKEIVLSVSQVTYAGQLGSIVAIKELSPQQRFDKDAQSLSSELQSSLDLMHQPVRTLVRPCTTCDSKETIGEAARRMTRKKADAVFIVQEGTTIGLVTDSDLRTRVLAGSLDSSRAVIEVMTAPVIALAEDALMYEALLVMKEKNISHLAVKDGAGRISGCLVLRDLVGFQQNAIALLMHEIASAEQPEQLARLYSRVPVLVRALTESGSNTENITHIISSVNDAIHRRVIALALETEGSPPCRFAFVVMGSEGRMEQTLATDQDNALVLENLTEEKEEQARGYFLALAGRINADLHRIGYQYCKGEVMARNPKWTQNLDTWKEYFKGWILDGNPHHIMEASIFFDFRHVYGDQSLVRELRDHVHRLADRQSVFFHHLAQPVMKFKSPLNLFGKIVGNETDADAVKVDIKKSLFPITAFLRLYAIREKLPETNSLDRALGLSERKVIDPDLLEDIRQALDFLTRLRLRVQVGQIVRQEPPDNLVDLHSLSRIDLSTFKKVLSQTEELQTRVRFDFKGME
ncbi:MAG: DUF294 nucleotidyltransferase-like domain-containing protein [Bacteroidales bacterium]